MIEKHFAAHIKTALDTKAINIRRERPRPAKEMAKPQRHGDRDGTEAEEHAEST